jgi:FKBP-type peptidyl-prolyl cis-trans isomerase FkpA
MSVTAVPLQPVKKSVRIWIWLGVIVAIAAAFGLAWWGVKSMPSQDEIASRMTNEQFLARNKTQPGVKTTESGLQYQIIKEGEGPTAQDGGAVFLNYEGTFRDGKVFDKSQQPTPFPVQDGASIPGFYEGLKLMKKGGEYRLWIPANLAYGERSPDPSRVPANSMLIFKVTVDRLMTPAEVQVMMQQMQTQGPPQGPEGAPQGRQPQQ